MLSLIVWFFFLGSSLIHSRHALHLPYVTNSTDCPEESNVCVTPECIRAAANILYSIDQSVSPCDDFYQFSCGSWMDWNEIPKGKASITPSLKLGSDHDIRLRNLLAKNISESDPDFAKMSKRYYSACMDEEKVEAAGSEPLAQALRALGGWPVIEGEKWNESDFDWMDTIIRFRKFGFNQNILLSVYVDYDYKDNKKNIIELDQTLLGAPDDLNVGLMKIYKDSANRGNLRAGLSNPWTAKYFGAMVNAAKKLGANESTVEEELKKALDFEIALATNFEVVDKVQGHEKAYNKYNVAGLEELAPKIDWLKYFNGLMNDPISDSEPIIVYNPKFVASFADLITNTDKRVVANYMMWRAALNTMDLLSKEWRDMKESLYIYPSLRLTPPRWRVCIPVYLEIAASAYYARTYFTDGRDEALTDLTNLLRKNYLANFQKIDWMEEESKRRVVEQIERIEFFIGSPQEYFDDTAMTGLYENITITDNYYNNFLNIKKLAVDFEFKKLRKPYQRWWIQTAKENSLDVGYIIFQNSIELPSGIIHPPFFSKDQPQYLNFGAIGHIIGHEITHSYHRGSRLMYRQKYNISIWDDTTLDNFSEKVQCFIDQYDAYIAETGKKISGMKTAYENIADSTGLKQAYLAYQSWVKDHGAEPRLPGLDYSPNQLFWISAAKSWCGKITPERLDDNLINDPHAPNPVRVKGAWSNNQHFIADFGCAPDSPMNRENKCEIF